MPLRMDPNLKKHSPSAKLVYYVLAHNEPCTQQNLIQETRLAPRTVRSALTKLVGDGLVDSRCCIHDARFKQYSTT